MRAAVNSSNAAPSRGRAVLALAGLAVLVIALVLGLVLWLLGLLQPRPAPSQGHPAHRPSPGASGPVATPGTGAQDTIADKPMLHVPDSAASPQPLAVKDTNPPLTMSTPARGRSRSRLVATGFPHTPSGALAQLAAIDEAALDGGDPTHTKAVYRWAAQPGAVSLNDWNMYQGATGLYTVRKSLGQADYSSSFQTSEGLIKGSVGPDFTVACVLGVWSVSSQDSTTQRAGADCQRMVWTADGWRIGPGRQPAESPGTWPGSAEAVRAGWRALTRE